MPLFSQSMMRAARYHEFGGDILVEEVPKPSAPPGGVVVKVMATGVCRSDWHGWRGHDSDIVEHGLPFTPGHELSGIVVELGEGTTNFAVGDRVAVPFILSCGACRQCSRGRSTVCESQAQPGFTVHGSMAQFVALPRADRNLCKLPPEVTYIAAAALGCRTTTAFRAVVQRGDVRAGDVVVVWGCGGLGLSAVMVAVAQGARVIAVDTSGPACEKARELGAFACVDATGKGGELGETGSLLAAQQAAAQVVAITPDGVGADVAFDCAGFASTSEGACWSVRRAGRVVQVGLPIGGRDTVVPMARVANQELEIVGSHGLAADDMPRVLAMVASGKLRPQDLIEREVDLEEGARAIAAMDDGSPLGMTMVTSFE